MNKLDFQSVAAAALGAVDSLLSEWLPGGKYKGHEFFALNPTRADKSLGSFAINTNTGEWSDYATGDAGGDLISLYAYLFCSGKQGDAFRAVSERLNIGGFEPVQRVEWDGSPKVGGGKSKRDSWTPIAPFEEGRLNLLSGARAYDFARNKRQEGLRAVYRDADGKPLCVVQRFIEADGGKSDYPFSWCQNAEGVQQWCNRRVQDPQPLFGLDALAAHPEWPVLVVEGEKCKMVAESSGLLNGWVVLSWLGGCNGWKKGDWVPLAGRDVVLWADCDSQRRKPTKQEAADGMSEWDMPYLPREQQPGMKAMLGIAEKLHGLGCSVRLVDVPEPGVWPNGYDIADVIQDTEPLTSVAELLADSALLTYSLTAADLPEVSPRPFDNERVRKKAHSAIEGGAGADYAENGGWRDDEAGQMSDEQTPVAKLLENYAQVGLKNKAISLETGESFTFKQLGTIYTQEAVTHWSWRHDRKRMEEFEAAIFAKRKTLERLAKTDEPFKDLLNRYIYLDGTVDAFDIQLDMVVPLNAVKARNPEQFEDWQKSVDRLICPISNYVFEPDLPCGVSFDDDAEDGLKVSYINMFKGLPIPAPADVEPLQDGTLKELKALYPGCRHVVGLIEHLCSGNGDKAAVSAEWVLNWVACRFRWPERKPATALVFISETQGVGKSTFGERIIKGLFGEYTRQLNQDALESRFNAALQNGLVTIFEEISPSDERMNVIGKLKNMITSDVIMVEKKQRDVQKFSDYNSFIIFSNDERSIPIESNDRRFMVSSCARKFSDEQYLALHEELESGGLEEFAKLLYALPLMHQNDKGERVPFTPHSKPLMTTIKRRMVNLNKPGWEAFIDDWHAGEVKAPFVTCAASDLWAVYKAWCAETKTFSMTQKNFYANIGKRLQDVRTWVNIRGVKKRIRLFVVPHSWLSQENQKRWPAPNTDQVQRGGDDAVNKDAYYGKQVEEFNRLADLPPL